MQNLSLLNVTRVSHFQFCASCTADSSRQCKCRKEHKLKVSENKLALINFKITLGTFINFILFITLIRLNFPPQKMIAK